MHRNYEVSTQRARGVRDRVNKLETRAVAYTYLSAVKSNAVEKNEYALINCRESGLTRQVNYIICTIHYFGVSGASLKHWPCN